MADPHPTHLITAPKPVVTRYNRLVLYAGLAAVGLVVCTYLLVMREHGRRVASAPPMHLVSLPAPLVTDIPKAKPEPPPEPQPQPPSQPAVSVPPVQQSSLPAPKKDNPLEKMRFDERVKAYRGPILVKFDGALPTPSHPEQSLRVPQVLEVPPAQSQPPPALAAPQQLPSFGSPYPEELPTWAYRDATGRNADFWGLSGFARSPQYAAAHLLPPRSPYQINAGMQIPVVLGQDLTSDAESLFSAIVSTDVYDSVSGRFLLVPAGSRIFGIADVDAPTNQQPTLMLAAKTLYLPNGYSIALSGAPGVNGMGLSGVSDLVNRHYLQRYGAAAFLSLVTAGIRMATYSGRGGLWYLTPEDAAAQGMGQVLGQATGEDLRRTMNIRPTVSVRAGYSFNVTVVQDLVFPSPYATTSPQVATNDSREELR
jgi:type IV secretory pathway VirB10-like protein